MSVHIEFFLRHGIVTFGRPVDAERRRSARARNVLWTLAVVTVVAVATCSYTGFGRTSVNHDRGNVRLAADTNGTVREVTNDLGRPEDAQTQKVHRPDASEAQTVTATTTAHWTAHDETRLAVTAAAAVREDPTKEERSADGDMSHGSYRKTTADG